MAIDPNIPPTGRDRLNNPNVPHTTATTTRSGSSGWMIGLVVLAIIIVAGFFMWPDRASNVAGQDPATTGTTTGRTTTAPTPVPAPAPAPVTPITPAPTQTAPVTPAPR